MKVKQTLTPPQQASPYVVNLPQPPVRNAEEYLKAYIGYVYTAIGAITQEVASIELKLFQVKYVKGKPVTEEIYEHPILSVLHYVNQLETFYNIIEATQTYLELVGEAFWVVLGNGTTPKEFWLLRPDWIKVIPSPTDVIDHYNYYAGGIISDVVEIPKEFIVPFKYFHPMNPYRGKGPTQAAALPFDILNFAQEYNRNFFFNSAVPSMVFSTDQKISEQTTKRFLNQWQESFGGRSKSNKIAFLGNGLKLDKASFSNKDLDFTESMKAMRDDLLAVYKVPKTVLGLTEDVNRANADATTMAFMERTITPRMRKLVDSLNEFFVPMFVGKDGSYFLDFVDPSPQDVNTQLKKYQSGRMYTWMTPNEIRAEENLEPLPGGDDLFAPLGSPTGSVVSQSDPNEDNAPKSEDEQTETPDNQGNEEPVKPTSNEEAQPEEEPAGKGFFSRLFGGGKKQEKKEYTPPAYLAAYRDRIHKKHMVSIPVKRPEQLEQEELKKKFMPEIRKMIGQLLAQDQYSALTKKKGKLTKKEQELKDLIEEGIKGAKKKDDEAKKIRNKSKWTEEEKLAYWKAFIVQADKHKEKIHKAVLDVFHKQEDLVLEKLNDQNKAWRKRLGVKATVNSILPSIDDLNKMWDVLIATLTEIYIEQGNATLDFLGVGGTINTTTAFATQYLQEYSGTLIAGIDQTTLDKLRTTLATGYDNGEGVDALSNRVQDVFAEADSTRADQIAATESIRASNTASVEAYRQSGVVTGKQWLAELDEHTCIFCQDLNGQVTELDADFVDKGTTLEVDGQSLSVDYVDVGEPPLHVDCRCTTIPIIVGED